MQIMNQLLTGWTLATGEGSPLSILDQIKDYFANNWAKILIVSIKIIVIFIIGRIAAKIANKALEHMMVERERSPLKFDARRTKTIGKLIHNVISYTINFLSILLILSQLGVNLAPLLAGAGVLGLAVGFGAQSLVKDVISGFFIILEDQFAVGDVIQIRSYKGTVEEIGLRVTRIKTWTGEVHIIPNGSIQEVTNYSVQTSLAVIDVSVAYDTDVERVLMTLKDVVQRVVEAQPELIKSAEVLGLETISVTEMTFRITAECKPNTQSRITRLIKEEAQKAIHLDVRNVKAE